MIPYINPPRKYYTRYFSHHKITRAYTNYRWNLQYYPMSSSLEYRHLFPSTCIFGGDDRRNNLCLFSKYFAVAFLLRVGPVLVPPGFVTGAVSRRLLQLKGLT